MNEIDPTLVHILRRARRVVVFTGAGVSAESGIPTFRDALTGLWEQFDAEELATPRAFARDPALVWGWYEWRRMKVLAADPNAAHKAIAIMAQLVSQLTVVTQNVDDLHERAGNRDVIHLHGSIHAPRCGACGRPYAFAMEAVDELEGSRRLDPPHCAHCGGQVRPGVVWFGEQLPARELQQAFAAAEECDALLSIGTSSLVYPAADVPRRAAERGATVIQVNPHPTELDQLVQFNLRGPAGEVMPAILNAVWRK